MYKDILFLFAGFWGSYYFIDWMPNMKNVIDGSYFVDLIFDPNDLIIGLIWLSIGLVGYTITIATIMKNFHLKSIRHVNFEMVMHLITFIVSFYILLKEDLLLSILLISICLLLSIPLNRFNRD